MERELERFSQEIRYYLLKELQHMGFGHYGGSLSIVETLAVIYGKHLKASPETQDFEERDYFVLSKGHGGPALYATLFLKGYFPEAWLYTLNNNGTRLPSHPDRRLTPGVDMTTGSLGQGISSATGIALGNKIGKRDNYTYCIVGDGELNEGQCWEAIQFAAHRQLNKFILFIDDNKKQLDGYTKDISEPFDFVSKLEAFGFAAQRVNGASVSEIDQAIRRAKQVLDRPSCIVLDTVKGQGVPYIETLMDNHHLRPTEEDTQAIAEAIADLRDQLEGRK